MKNNTANKNQASFFAYLSATTAAITGDGTVLYAPFDSVLYNTSPGVNIANGIFTVPITGKWFINTNITFGALDASYTACTCDILQIAGKNYIGGFVNIGEVRQSSAASVNNSAIVDLAVGDTVAINISVTGGAKAVTVVSNGAADPLSWFCGFLIA